MGNFKRQKHGIRVNLSRLNRDIDELEHDKQELLRHGYTEEHFGVERKLRQLYSMRSDAIKHGYGYYDVKVSHVGRNLVLLVAGLLLLILLAGWLATVLG